MNEESEEGAVVWYDGTKYTKIGYLYFLIVLLNDIVSCSY